MITITLSYVAASEGKLAAQVLTVEQGLTMQQLLAKPDVVNFMHANGIDSTQQVGVFSHRIKNTEAYILSNGDRVEWYRSLKIDPMQLRAKKAQDKKASAKKA